MKDKTFRQLLIITVAVKIVVFLLIVWSYYQIPYCDDCRIIKTPFTFISAFKTWDAQQYLHLAEVGYQPNQPSNAFYPLYPLLIRVTGFIFGGNYFLAALLLTTLFSLLAIVYFYLYTKDCYDSKTAFIAALFLLAFPTAFYLNLIYTEALFLFLVMLAFYAVNRNQIALAMLAGLCLPLTRAIGLLALIPLVFQILFANRKTMPSALRWRNAILLAASFGLGFIIYLGIMKISLGSYFAGMEAQKFFLSNRSIEKMINPVAWIRQNFIDINFTFHGINTSIIDRIFFVSFLGLLGLIYKKLNLTLFLYAVFIGLISALSGELTSFPRYMLVIFPIFMALALQFPRRTIYFLIPQVFVQLVFLLAHAANYWVS